MPTGRAGVHTPCKPCCSSVCYSISAGWASSLTTAQRENPHAASSYWATFLWNKLPAAGGEARSSSISEGRIFHSMTSHKVSFLSITPSGFKFFQNYCCCSLMKPTQTSIQVNKLDMNYWCDAIQSNFMYPLFASGVFSQTDVPRSIDTPTPHWNNALFILHFCYAYKQGSSLKENKTQR